MPTRGLLCVHRYNPDEWTSYYIAHDSKSVLKDMRSKLLTKKTHKSVENLLLKYENEIINPITIHESLKRKPDIDYCFPWYEYILIVTLDKDGSVYIDKVLETLEDKFVAVEGQRKQKINKF